MAAPHRVTPPVTVQHVLDALHRAQLHGICVQISPLPGDAVFAECDGTLYIDPGQAAAAACTRVVECVDELIRRREEGQRRPLRLVHPPRRHEESDITSRRASVG